MPSSEVMSKWKSGTLHSGGAGGPVVRSQKQAVAIKLSEQKKERQNGGRYPDSDSPKKGHGSTTPKPRKSSYGGPVFE